MNSVTWKGNLAFEGHSKNGSSFVMDASRDHGGEGLGPSPIEALVCSAAACSAMDVISILQKKRQVVTSYHITIDYDRQEEGDYPRPITGLRLTHVLAGEDLDPAAVERAVQLSDEKYCSVIASLRANVSVVSGWKIA